MQMLFMIFRFGRESECALDACQSRVEEGEVTRDDLRCL